MFGNIQRTTLVLALALAWVPASEQVAASTLVDTRGHWAQQAIAEMSACGIVSGYPDSVFKPDSSVSRLEVVAVLIRAIGLEEEAKAKEKENVSYKMPPDLTWGKGYLILGVEKGMLDKDYLSQLQPGSPATRVEVAALVYLALKMKPASDGSVPAFADASQIPQVYLEYVNTMVAKNIMQGLPGNVFNPLDEVTRAQMAAIMSRLVENDLTTPAPTRHLSGTLSSVDLTGRLFTIQPGGSKSFAPDCDVFIGGKYAEPADLNVGDEVKLVLDKNGQIVFVKMGE